MHHWLCLWCVDQHQVYTPVYTGTPRTTHVPFYFFVLEVSPAPLPAVLTCCSTGLVRVGLKIPLHGNRTNMNGHLCVVHGHVWRTLLLTFNDH
jgi:hypothetical protein